MSSRWTKRDEFILLQGVGSYGLSWFARRLGRSYAAVRRKAFRLYGRGGLTRGAYTLSAVARMTGYHPDQLRRAARALAQKWKRTSPRGPYLIYEDQVRELTDWLKQGYWAPKHQLYACGWCGGSRAPHYALGLCRGCYAVYAQRIRRLGWPLSAEALLGMLQSELVQELPCGDYGRMAVAAVVCGRAIPERALRRLARLVRAGR